MRKLILAGLIAGVSLCGQRPEPGPGPLPEGVEARRDIAYDERSDAQKLDLYLPPTQPGDSLAAIVFVHGGGWRAGDKQRGQWSRMPARYAADGYVTISVNYRLTGEAPWPAQIEDVKAAVRWLRANASELGVDPSRIGAYGNSAGAHLVSLLGLVRSEQGLEGSGPNQAHSSLVQAVCASATPADFLNWGAAGVIPPRLGNTFLAGPPEGLQERARQASPVTYASGDAPAFLLVHGTADRTVRIQQSDRFAKALREAGAKEVRYMIFDGEGHGVFQSQRLLTYPAMKAFFDEALKR